MEWKELRLLIESKFSLQEIKELCLNLKVDYDELGEGLKKSIRIHELIKHSQAEGKIHNLLAELSRARPNVKWPGSLNSELLSIGKGFPLPSPFEWKHISSGLVNLSKPYIKSTSKKTTINVLEFAIAKFPITNAQFHQFVISPDGYSNHLWWKFSEQALLWRKVNPKPMPTAFQGGSLPRTNISWYESVAFCKWLSHETKLNISLPNESQWQRAAKGDTVNTYPWGNESRVGRCNYSPSTLDSVALASVEEFSNGESPYGVSALSGHVWEWCLNEWETGENHLTETKHKFRRSLRGGSWRQMDNKFFHSTYRETAHLPTSRGASAGFRIALNLI